MNANDCEDPKDLLDLAIQLEKAGDALLAAAFAVYDNDDAFTEDSTDTQLKARHVRDRALLTAIDGYKRVRGITE